MAIRRDDFPLPDLSDERVAPFFAGAARHELTIPRCDGCGRLVWYPEPACPTCGGTSFTWTAVRGSGRLYSWAVVRRAFLPAFADRVPFVTGLVALDDDPAVRIVTYIVDCDPLGLRADDPVRVRFEDLSFPTVPGRSVTVPVFTPERASESPA